MPRDLKEMPKSERAGRSAKHPYNDWFDKAAKNPIELVQGDDFDSKTRTMRHNLYRFAKTQGHRIHTVTINNEDGTESIALEVVGKRKDIKDK